jgi:hypothetical protein
MPAARLKMTVLMLATLAVAACCVAWAFRVQQGQAAAVDDSMSKADALQVPMPDSAGQRARFEAEFLKRPKSEDYPFRDLYQEYLSSIGANGLLTTLWKIDPSCHEEAHDAGKVIYAKLRDVGAALRACQTACTDGCMHGVVMEFFAASATATKEGDSHVELADVEKGMGAFCRRAEFHTAYDQPDCAHGVGHAVMYLADYDIGKALEACRRFDDGLMSYYCATGAYMEYLTTHDKEDGHSHGLFYPCENASYSRACFAYKVPHILVRKKTEPDGAQAVADACLKLDRTQRESCFYGFGVAFMEALSGGNGSLASICRFGDRNDQDACIEGAMANMARYHPQQVDRLCAALPSEERGPCLASGSSRGAAPQ